MYFLVNITQTGLIVLLLGTIFSGWIHTWCSASGSRTVYVGLTKKETTVPVVIMSAGTTVELHMTKTNELLWLWPTSSAPYKFFMFS